MTMSYRCSIRAARRTGTRRSLVSLPVLLLVTAISQAQTGTQPDSKSVARGRQLYNAHCVACHKRDGVGEPAVPWSIRRTDFIEAMALDETSHAWHHGDEQLPDQVAALGLLGAWNGLPGRRFPKHPLVLVRCNPSLALVHRPLLRSDASESGGRGRRAATLENR